MNKQQLTSYAVLRRMHEKQKDLLNAYVPFVEHSIFEITVDKKHIETIELKEYIKSNYNLNIPISTIKSILKKLVRKNLITQIQGYKYIETSEITEEILTNFIDCFDDCKRDRNSLVLNFVEFAGIDTDKTDVILDNFYDYINDSISIINLSTNKKIDACITNETYIQITEYINYLKENDNINFSIFKDIYYGIILSKITEVSEMDELSHKISSLEIILDSNFAFRLLNYQNTFFNQASHELFELLKRNGFKIRILLVTIQEMRRVLDHRYKLICKGKVPESVPHEEAQHIDGILGAIYRKGLSKIDLEYEIRDLEINLEKLEIIVDRQDYLKDIKISESDSKEYYKTKITNLVNSKKMDEVDIDMDMDEIIEKGKISDQFCKMINKKCEIDLKIRKYIEQLRKKDIYRFTEAKFIFLTCDKKFSSYTNSHKTEHKINEVFLDDTLTNILWLKNPEKSDDLPLGKTLSIYKSSSFVDFKIFTRFNIHLTKLSEKDPSRFELIGDIFSNQTTISKLKEIEECNESEDLSEEKFDNIIDYAIQQNSTLVQALAEQLENSVKVQNIVENNFEEQSIDYEHTKGKLSATENILNLTKEQLSAKDLDIIRLKKDSLNFKFNALTLLTFTIILLKFFDTAYDSFKYIWNNFGAFDYRYLLSISFTELTLTFLLAYFFVSFKEYPIVFDKYLKEEISKATVFFEILYLILKSSLWLLTTLIIPLLSLIIKVIL